MLKFACTQDDNSEFCLALFALEDAQRQASCPDEQLDAEGCFNNTCSAALTNFVTDTGCCVQTFFDFQIEQGAVSPQEVENIKEFIKTACSAGELEPACTRVVGQDRASRSFFFRLKKEFFNSLKNKEDFTENARRDFVGNLALWEGDVTIEFLEDTAIEDGDDIIIEAVITFQAENDQLQADIEVSFDEDAANGRLSFPNSGQQYAAAFGEPLEASPLAPIVGTDDKSTNGAGQLAASLLIVGVCAVLAL
jgi:hypothetical protein